MKRPRTNRRRVIGLVAALLALSPVALAEAPKVGESAPPLSLRSTTGEELSLESLRGRSAVILVFYRGAW